jgi:hypothetical protein
MDTPLIKFYKLRDFGAKMNATVEFLRENIGRLFLNLLFIAGPLALLLSLLFGNIMGSMFDLSRIENQGDAASVFGFLGGNYLLMMFISWLAVSMIVTITYTYIRLYNEGVAKETAITDVLRLALKKYGGILLVGFMVTTVTILGAFFFLIPGIFLGITLSLAYPIYMFEDVSAGEAFSRSFKLIKEKWWSTFGLLIISCIMAYVVQLVFSIPMMAVYFTNIFTLMEDVQRNPDNASAVFEMFSSTYMTVAMTISMIGSYLTYSIPLIALGFQYSNLVERNEGRGLMNEIEDFDKSE